MTEKEVKKIIGSKNWKKFCKWMNGQTVSGYPDGSTNYYECDVENFICKLVNGKEIFFD